MISPTPPLTPAIFIVFIISSGCIRVDKYLLLRKILMAEREDQRFSMRNTVLII